MITAFTNDGALEETQASSGLSPRAPIIVQELIQPISLSTDPDDRQMWQGGPTYNDVRRTHAGAKSWIDQFQQVEGGRYPTAAEFQSANAAYGWNYPGLTPMPVVVLPTDERRLKTDLLTPVVATPPMDPGRLKRLIAATAPARPTRVGAGMARQATRTVSARVGPQVSVASLLKRLQLANRRC
jgi:hypothetical protein